MPFGKGLRKLSKQVNRYEKKKYRSQSGSYSRKKQFIPRNMQIVPVKQTKTLRYVDDITLSVGVADIPKTHFFSCNGLYDPDITGVGHQPMGFDVIMPLYDHYVGIGATITATFTSTSTTSAGLAKVGICLKDSASVSFGTNSHVMEQQRCITRHLGTMGSDKGIQVIKWKVNPNTFLSRSKPLSDPDIRGTASTNPAEQCYFVLWATGISTTAVPATVICEVQIEYTGVFIEPKLLGQS